MQGCAFKPQVLQTAIFVPLSKAINPQMIIWILGL